MTFTQVSQILEKLNTQVGQDTESSVILAAEEWQIIQTLLKTEYDKLNTDITPAQQKYINDICAALQISQPVGLDKKTASDFIKMHQQELREYNKEKNQTVFSPASYRFYIK